MTPTPEIIDKITAWRDSILSDPDKLNDVISDDMDAISDVFTDPLYIAIMVKLIGVQETLKTIFVMGAAWQHALDSENSPLSLLLGDVNIPDQI